MDNNENSNNSGININTLKDIATSLNLEDHAKNLLKEFSNSLQSNSNSSQSNENNNTNTKEDDKDNSNNKLDLEKIAQELLSSKDSPKLKELGFSSSVINSLQDVVQTKGKEVFIEMFKSYIQKEGIDGLKNLATTVITALLSQKTDKDKDK